MKFKNPFKKSSLTDTLVNVGIGGGANAAIDYAWEQIEAVKQYDEYKDAAKLVLGALVGSMVSNKYARAAADGIATVGVSSLVAKLIEGESIFTNKTPSSTDGLPNGTIGRIRYGAKRFGKRGKIAGDFIAAD